jgi:hypothetical protein
MIGSVHGLRATVERNRVLAVWGVIAGAAGRCRSETNR